MARLLAPKTANSTKIMVYSHDAFGLGNIRRMLAICTHLLKSIPNLSILVLSGSPMLQSFRLPQGLDYIKLPCINRGESGEMAVKYLNADIESTIRLRSELILAAAKNYQPDLVLVDKKPYGIKGELTATIDYLKKSLPETKLVLLLRDILDAPEKTTREWQKEGYYDAVESLYDRVLVAGMPEIFNLCVEYQFTDAITKKVDFCGYLRKEPGLKSRRIVRRELNIQPQEKLVLVTPGGGEDGYELINTYLTGITKVDKKEKIRSLIFCGPEMPLKQQKKVAKKAKLDPQIEVLEFTDDLMSYIDAADLVVCMSGYNTICEVLSAGKLAIAIPRTKPAQEQQIRAKYMAQRGFLDTIHPNDLTSNLLIDSILEKLNNTNGHPIASRLDLNGLPRISKSISQLLFDPFCTGSIALLTSSSVSELCLATVGANSVGANGHSPLQN
ncbi:MAG: glycosyltransferase family protein [Xenococcaceae cyanobacterium]